MNTAILKMHKRYRKPIFFDGGKRWRTIKRATYAFFLFVFILFSFTAYSFASAINLIENGNNREDLHLSIEEINNNMRLVQGSGTFLSIEKINDRAYIKRSGEDKKIVSLTFDDGPHPEYTKKVLEILESERINGTFFVLGQKIVENPEIGKEILEQGSDMGLHTFTHAENIEDKKLDPIRFFVEFDLSERVFAHIYGYNNKLFRIPYVGLEDTLSYDALQFLREAKERGFTVSAPTVDSVDWDTNSKRVIVRNSISDEVNTAVILFHDSGEDKEALLAALPEIIGHYKSQGYEFMTISQLAENYGLIVKEELTLNDKAISFLAYNGYSIYKNTPNLLNNSFLVGFYLVLLHTGVFVIMAIIRINRSAGKKEKGKGIKKSSSNPLVTVIIPMFNEEKSIKGVIRSVLKSTYKNFELIVVDDGSTDRSFERAAKFLYESRFTLLFQANGGKVKALNNGISQAKGQITVFVDADTRIKPGALKKIIYEFDDRKVAAVAGTVRVGNAHNLITRLQAVEYMLMQAIEKRAFDLFRNVLIVPGAFGAWRTSILKRNNGFSTRTHAEDFDLTLFVLMKKYKVKFSDTAIAETEAPSSLRQLITQRVRWSYGTLQVYSKYRKMIFNKKYGILGMFFLPRAVFFQVISILIAPFVDLFIILNILFGERELTLIFVGFYLILQSLVFLFAAQSMKYPIRYILIIPIARFYYMQLLYLVFYFSILKALKGDGFAWVKLQHFGKFNLAKS